jgi:hypothetical protein
MNEKQLAALSRIAEGDVSSKSVHHNVRRVLLEKGLITEKLVKGKKGEPDTAVLKITAAGKKAAKAPVAA